MVSQNTIVLGVSLPNPSINSTSQSNCFNMSVRATLFIENRRLHLFGLTNNWMGSFIVRSSMTVLSVILSVVPVSAKTGVPTINKIHKTPMLGKQHSPPPPLPLWSFDSKVSATAEYILGSYAICWVITLFFSQNEFAQLRYFHNWSVQWYNPDCQEPILDIGK